MHYRRWQKHGDPSIVKTSQGGRGKPRSTRGKTWEEIYSDPQFIKRKREQLKQLASVSPSQEAKAKMSATKREMFANGTLTPSFLGRKHSQETKNKISKTRRERYGTKASINKQIRYTSKYRQWRTEIFERDQYACQYCGASSAMNRARVRLEAHHIIPFWKLINGLTFDEAMTDPNVWDSTNAVTLCASCHAKIPIGPYWEV